MDIVLNKENKSYAIKVEAREEGKILGSAYLYIMFNDLHKEPFGFLENVFVKEGYRGKGVGSKLVEAVIAEAKKQISSESRAENQSLSRNQGLL